MNKEQYQNKSKKMDLPPRCPLMGNCERWAQTIFFYKYFDSYLYKNKSIDFVERLIEGDIIGIDFNETCIKVVAEHPEFLRANEQVSYRNMCPEVNLFDDEYALPFAKGTASISGEFDEYRIKFGKPGLNNYSEKHYSECLEFSQYVFQYLDKKRISKYFNDKKNRRTPISTKLRFEIFTRDKYRCQYCGRTINDGISLEIDHKIPIAEGGTDNYDNLITACNECNSGKSNKIL